MGRARAQARVPGPLAEVQAAWYDARRWPDWVDGCAAVERVAGDWPRDGEVVWRGTAGGRGRVTERVASFEDGRGQELEVSDETLRGRQTVRFDDQGDGQVAVGLELRYGLARRTPLSPLVDALFIRRAVRDSLARTLRGFAHQLR